MTSIITHDPFSLRPFTGVKKNVAKFLASRDDLKGKKIVDLCCGDGVTAAILRSMGAEVSLYDLIPDSCKLDDKPAQVDVLKPLPIADESADIVIFQEVIEHIPNQLFVFQEIFRILKPGGELFLTTPSKSSIQSRLSFLTFESEHIRHTPWGACDGVWGANDKGEKYYGHLFLIGIQQMRAFAKVAGFSGIKVHKNEISRTSAWFFPIVYPFVYLMSLRALRSDLRGKEKGSKYWQEKMEQFRLNISREVLLSKYSFVSFYK